jgi:hypothetical protein
VTHNNAMNLTNRGVPGMKERRASGEPVLAEVGAPVILSLGLAGYCSVIRTRQRSLCASDVKCYSSTRVPWPERSRAISSSDSTRYSR